MTAPTALAPTWDLVADAYVVGVAPHFEAFARGALDDAAVGPGTALVDVACGPGTVALLAAARGARVCALDFAPAMVAHLRARAHERGLDVDALVGDGQALPYDDETFDAATSMFGLMFFPDRAAGFRELRRVLRRGGTAVVSSWLETHEVPLLFDAISTLMVAAGAPAGPPPRPGLSLASDYADEMGGAGFVDVVVERREARVPFSSSSALTAWMAGSAAPVVVMRKTMGEAAFGPVLERWNALLAERVGDGPLALPLVAWVARAHRP